MKSYSYCRRDRSYFHCGVPISIVVYFDVFVSDDLQLFLILRSTIRVAADALHGDLVHYLMLHGMVSPIHCLLQHGMV